MKKILQLTGIIVLLSIFTGCSKDDKNSFDYDADLLFGRWRIIEAEYEGNYIDVTENTIINVKDEETGNYTAYPFGATYATFTNQMNYRGAGSFGEGMGTYKFSGKKIEITIYADKLIYEVLSFYEQNGESYTEFSVLQHKSKDIPFSRIKLHKL
ncbi:MAG: hypothetical protein LIO79_10035 [Rikenellaceae bacterium]|nr:hypothetical protein [Rikenellaceae bacterium]